MFPNFTWAFIATSVEVERTFSRGRLLLLHTRSALSAASTCAVLCLGQWSLLGFIKDHDLEVVAKLPELEGDESDGEFDESWGNITDSDSSDDE